MHDEVELPDPGDSAALRYMLLLDGLIDVKATTDGYRARALDTGYSQQAAEMMATDLHRAMIQAMFFDRSKRNAAPVTP